MTNIANESQFKKALSSLDAVGQRVVGTQFVRHVLALTDDERIGRILDAAENTDSAAEAMNAANQSAKSAIRDSFTRCGADGDWRGQAAYFVARAAAALVGSSQGQIKGQIKGKGGPALQAAMHSRMARTCEHIEAGGEAEHEEAEQQYRILQDYLDSKGG